jgi:1-acyl-sn-glycerol-3-phosphate acyltransferase
MRRFPYPFRYRRIARVDPAEIPVMMLLIGLIRIPVFLIIVGAYLALCSVGGAFCFRGRRRQAFLAGVTSFGSRLTLRLFGVSVSVNGREKGPDCRSPRLAVANHLSYLDILILSSLYRSLFIASVEVQRTFFLGTLASFGGSLFVERRSKTGLLREIDRIAETLRAGAVVTLFPEGTSSNGVGVLPFKGSLFTAAEKAGVEVLPICIRYRAIEGKPITPENRDLAFYYGDIRFFPHLLRLFFVRSIDISVTFLDRIETVGRERKAIAEEAYKAIVECGLQSAE